MKSPKNVPNRLLSQDQVREIWNTFQLADKIKAEAGKKLAPYGLNRRLADKYGVSRRTIENIRSGARYAGITGGKPRKRGGQPGPRKRILRPRKPVPGG